MVARSRGGGEERHWEGSRKGDEQGRMGKSRKSQQLLLDEGLGPKLGIIESQYHTYPGLDTLCGRPCIEEASR